MSAAAAAAVMAGLAPVGGTRGVRLYGLASQRTDLPEELYARTVGGAA